MISHESHDFIPALVLWAEDDSDLKGDKLK
jgi:hypothetical protein